MSVMFKCCSDRLVSGVCKDSKIHSLFAKILLPSDSKMRRLVLESIVIVRKFCTELVGSNKFKTAFDPEYKQDDSIEGYDRIGR